MKVKLTFAPFGAKVIEVLDLDLVGLERDNPFIFCSNLEVCEGDARSTNFAIRFSPPLSLSANRFKRWDDRHLLPRLNLRVDPLQSFQIFVREVG